MNILVTGASGFVGGAIVRKLYDGENSTDKIFAFGRRKFENELRGVSDYKVDITNKEQLKEIVEIKRLDAIVHSAGLAHRFGKVSAEDFFKVNVAGTENILRFGLEREVRHFILISSVSVYGAGRKDRGISIGEETPCAPEGAYAQSKYESELKAVELCKKNGIALTILRLATVIGEGDPGNVLRLIEAIDGRRFLMIGRGENYKSLIYAEDVARAVRHILFHKKTSAGTPEIFNLTGEPVRMKFLVDKIYRSLGGKKSKFYVPEKILMPPLAAISKIFSFRKAETLRRTLEKWKTDERFSGAKILEEYSFKPETDISEAIEREVEYYRKNRC